MKKHSYWILAVIVISAMILAACQQTGGETGAVDWSKVEPAKEITFWHQHSGDRETELLKVVDAFNATNEYGITLTAEYAGGYGDIFTKMLPILNTPDVPDVVVGYQNQTVTYQLADAMWDMNEIIDDPTWGMPRKIRMISSLVSLHRTFSQHLTINDWACRQTAPWKSYITTWTG